MKILRIIYDFPPPWDGLAPFPYELSKAQVEHGHKVTVICGLWPKQEPKLSTLPQNLKLIKIPREPIKNSLFFTTAPWAFLIAIKELLLNKYDVIQGHGQLPLCYLIFRTLFKIPRTPYYHFLHITAAGREQQAKEHNQHIDFVTQHIEWPLHKLADKLGCRLAKKVFVTGINIKREAINYYNIPEEKLVVIENGVNPTVFSPRGGDKREELGFENEDKVIIYVGAHNDRKNIDKIIISLQFLPKRYKFVSVGGGSDSYLKQLYALAEDGNTRDRIKYVGYEPYPIPEYYRSANILVLPSSYEGFPKVALEALACGVEVLASGFETKEKINGLFQLETLNPEGMAEEIQKIVEDDKGVDTRAIKETYSWETLAKTIDSHIKV